MLTDIHPDLLDFSELLVPLRYTIRRLFLLQSAQNGLVLDRNAQQFLLPLFTIEARLHNLIRIVQGRLVLLHDVRHLLQEDSVFALNLRIPSCLKHLRVNEANWLL